jgi:hypothetical protein
VRVDQEGDVYRVVHEDTGKVLCTGSADDIKHWTEQPKKAKAARAAAEAPRVEA